MNSTTTGVMVKIKDTDRRYLLQPAVASGMPATLLSYPVVIDEAHPDIAANSHPTLFRDIHRAYVIADAGDIRITLDANITCPGMFKWYVRKRVGGIIGDQTAVVAIRCSTS